MKAIITLLLVLMNINLILLAQDEKIDKPIAKLGDGTVHSVTYSPDGKYLAVGYISGRIKILNAKDLEEIQVIDSNWPISSVAYSPDGKYLASGSTDKTIRIWVLNL